MKISKKLQISITFVVLLLSSKYSANAQEWQTNGSNIYYNTGKVGVGTHVPEGLLSLYDPSSSLGISIQSGTQSKYWIGQNKIDNTFFIGGSGNTLPSTGYIVMNNSGNVRIPSSLRVESSADIANNYADSDPNSSWNYNLYINNNNTSLNAFSRIAFGSQGTGLGAITYKRTGSLSSDLHLQVRNGSNYTTRLFVRSDGNVGIGTTDPQSLLSVKGKISAQEVQVTLSGWSDYVFFDSYKLRPLSDVETFIQEHKHLPDVPSAAVVQKEGVNLGDMDAILLRKIEELTLYMIEMKKDNDEIKKQNQLLLLKNEELEKKIK